MLKVYCDGCKEEAKDMDFRFEAVLREIKKTLADPQPKLVEKQVHLCKKCYKKSLESLLTK